MPQEARLQVRMECDVAPRHLTLIERRAPWREELGPQWSQLPIARLHYTQGTGLWTLYWRDRNLKFHRYERVPPTADIQILLAEVEADPPRSSGGSAGDQARGAA